MEYLDFPKCFVCGNIAHFWIDLGDFVVGISHHESVCKKHLTEVLKECVYQAEKWKFKTRFTPISIVYDFLLSEDEKKEIDQIWKKEFERTLKRKLPAEVV